MRRITIADVPDGKALIDAYRATGSVPDGLDYHTCVRVLRIEAGYSQQGLARALGVSTSHVCNVEAGRGRAYGRRTEDALVGLIGFTVRLRGVLRRRMVDEAVKRRATEVASPASRLLATVKKSAAKGLLSERDIRSITTAVEKIAARKKEQIDGKRKDSQGPVSEVYRVGGGGGEGRQEAR